MFFSPTGLFDFVASRLQEEVEEDGSAGVEAEVLHGGEGRRAAQHEGEEVRQRRV